VEETGVAREDHRPAARHGYINNSITEQI